METKVKFTNPADVLANPGEALRRIWKLEEERARFVEALRVHRADDCVDCAVLLRKLGEE